MKNEFIKWLAKCPVEAIENDLLKFSDHETGGRLMTKKDLIEICHYCGGDCPNQPDESDWLCDGFAGDIDNIYMEED